MGATQKVSVSDKARRMLLERLEPRVFLSSVDDLLALAAGAQPAGDTLSDIAQTGQSTTQTTTSTAKTRAVTVPIVRSGGGDQLNTTTGDDSPVRPPSDFRYVLRPGTGFAGPSLPDQTIDNEDQTQLGWDEKAIARWDVMPYQTFDNYFSVGVVAFHMNGIKEVDFSVNGGAWTAVRSMTRNPQTGVTEYTAMLRATDFADGQIEVRAIAYPTVGQPRVLGGAVTNNGTQSIYLYANANHTLPQPILYVATTGDDLNGDGSASRPFASLKKASQMSPSGASIYLQPGTYTFDTPSVGYNTNDRWITITPAPGVTRDQIILRPSGLSLRVCHLAVSNVRVDCTVGGDFDGWKPSSGVWTDSAIWVDNCEIFSSLGKDHTPSIQPAIGNGWVSSFLTDSTIHDFPGHSVQTVSLLRNVEIYNIEFDAIDNPQLVINTNIHDMTDNAVGDHNDAIQYYPDHSDMNSIVYGAKATNVAGQLLFGGLLLESQGGPHEGVFSNVAVVNFLGTSSFGPSASPEASQIGGGQGRNSEHLLFYNITLPNQSFYFTDQLGATFKNTVVGGCAFWRFYSTFTTGVTLNTSHIIDYANESNGFHLPSVYTDYTTGDPGFIALPRADGTYSPTGDFHLLSGSILRNRGMVLLARVDIENHARSLADSIGAFSG